MSLFDDARRKNDASGNDDQRFELLVDGALSEAERRKLLTSLDQQPSGWRRCALAFLEDQCFKEAIKPLGDEAAIEMAAGDSLGAGLSTALGTDPALGAGLLTPPKSSATVQPSGKQTQRRKLPLGRLGTVLAMAASFVVAVYLGSLSVRVRHGHGSGSPSGGEMFAVNRQPRAPMTRVPDSQLATGPQRPVEVRNQPGASNGGWHTVAVSMPGGPQGQGETIQLPALEGGDKVDPSWLQNLPEAPPRDVLDSLERTGHVVRQQRELVPLRMNDGRELVVPVDTLEVHYAGRPVY